jgi:hypothetical protein
MFEIVDLMLSMAGCEGLMLLMLINKFQMEKALFRGLRRT